MVCRVDVEDCGDLSEAECVLLCNDSSETSRPGSEGINRIVVMDDNLLWTASGTSTIKRWHIPPKRPLRVSSPIPLENDEPRMLGTPPPNRRLTEIAAEASPGRQPNRMPSVPSIRSGSNVSESRERGNSIETTLHGIPYDSLIKLLSAHDPFAPYTNRNRDPEVATLYSAASIMSVQRANRHPSSPLATSRTEDTIMPSSAARANYEDREIASEAIPYCSEPDDVLTGDSGLVRCIILNDRIHALTVDTTGEVAVWDIVRAVCLGRYLPEDVAAASHSGSVDAGSGEGERSPREALEAVRERIEGEAAISAWCSADTKVGVLSVHLNERCFDAEVYADEVGFVHDKYMDDETKCEFVHSLCTTFGLIVDWIQVNVGKWVLRNLFIGFIREELHIKKLQDSPSQLKETALPPSVSRSDRDKQLPDSPRRARHRSSSSTERNRHRSRPSQASAPAPPASNTVTISPKMIPAVPPAITNFPRSSPLLTPLIPLVPVKDLLTPIVQSPPHSPSIESATNTTTIHGRARSGTVDGHITRTPSVSGSNGGDYFTLRTRQQSISSPNPSEDASTAALTPKAEVQPPPTPSTPSGLMGRLKSFAKKRPASETASPLLGGATPTAESLAAAEVRFNSIHAALCLSVKRVD